MDPELLARKSTPAKEVFELMVTCVRGSAEAKPFVDVNNPEIAVEWNIHLEQRLKLYQRVSNFLRDVLDGESFVAAISMNCH